MRNTWVTCRDVGDTHPKGRLIPHELSDLVWKAKPARAHYEGPAAYQLVGGVTAYQSDDG